MTQPIFLSSRPDYFPTIYTPHSWEKILMELERIPAGSTICLDSNGLSTAGKIYTLWQKIKGFFGFENMTDESKIGAFLAKFMYQGAVLGYMQSHESKIRSLHSKMNAEELKVHQAVKGFFNFDEISRLNGRQMQQKLVSFFHENEESIKPSFWNRICAPTIDLPPTARFGEVHLTLAQEQVYINPEQSLENFYTAALLCKSQDHRYTEDLVRAFEKFVDSTYCKSPKIAAVELLLAEKMYALNENLVANRLFSKAARHQGIFTEKQKVYHLHSSSLTRQYDDAENRSAAIDISNEAVAVKKLFAETMIGLGDYYYSKINTHTTRIYHLVTLGTAPSPAEHARQAAKFYARGLVASRHDLELLTIHHRILEKNLAIASYLPPADFHQPLHLSPAEQLTQIYAYLGSLKRMDLSRNLTSVEGKQTIMQVTSSILQFYLLGESTLCLEAIEKALQCIGPVKERFQIKSTWRNSHAPSIQCKTPNLVNQVDGINYFTFNPGASLHFLRAELLRKKFGDTLEALEEYKLAVHLAPLNPFGADSLFMVDEQEQPSRRSNDINSYRSLAIEWGSEELKETIYQLNNAVI